MVFAFVMTITPGPNNVLLLASGLAFGVRRTGWHMAGILVGVLLLIGLVGSGLGVLFAREPNAQIALMIAGSLYMLWLAGKLWRAGELQAATVVRPIRFHEAAMFQLLNPKTWLMATTVISVFVPPGEHYAERVVAAGLLFNAVALPCISLWAASGEALRRWIQSPVALQRINRAMAVLAAATVFLFWI
jgi:threonine/homoserine/homoserine lactone efflux protein